MEAGGRTLPWASTFIPRASTFIKSLHPSGFQSCAFGKIHAYQQASIPPSLYLSAVSTFSIPGSHSLLQETVDAQTETLMRRQKPRTLDVVLDVPLGWPVAMVFILPVKQLQTQSCALCGNERGGNEPEEKEKKRSPSPVCNAALQKDPATN